jgi:hypothetical protein
MGACCGARMESMEHVDTIDDMKKIIKGDKLFITYQVQIIEEDKVNISLFKSFGRIIKMKV